MLCLAGRLEPRVLFTGVPGHEVEKHVDASFVCGGEKIGEVLVGAVACGDFLVIAHVVARIFERRVVAGVYPQRCGTQRRDVIEFGSDARQITDAVTIGIGKRLGIDFIKHCVAQPFCVTCGVHGRGRRRAVCRVHRMRAGRGGSVDIVVKSHGSSVGQGEGVRDTNVRQWVIFPRVVLQIMTNLICKRVTFGALKPKYSKRCNGLSCVMDL